MPYKFHVFIGSLVPTRWRGNPFTTRQRHVTIKNDFSPTTHIYSCLTAPTESIELDAGASRLHDRSEASVTKFPTPARGNEKNPDRG